MQIGKYRIFQEVGGARELLSCYYSHMRVRSRSREEIQCVKIFTLQKNLLTNFSPIACIGEIGENFRVHGNFRQNFKVDSDFVSAI